VDLMTRIWSGLSVDVGALASCPDCKLRTANKRRTRSRDGWHWRECSGNMRGQQLDWLGSGPKRKREMTMKKATAEQAELILKLYELRRETVMRQARTFVGGQFLPRSAEELVRSKQGRTRNGICAAGLWGDMVCAFVKHGVLSEGIVYDNAKRCTSNMQRFSRT